MISKVFWFTDFENAKKSGIEFAYTGNSSLRFILREHIVNIKLSARKIRFLKKHVFFMMFSPILSTPPTKTCLLSSPRAKNHQKSGEPPAKLINKPWKTWQNLFQYLKSQFQFTMIVSHIDSMRDAVDTLLEIKKENSFSNVSFD